MRTQLIACSALAALLAGPFRASADLISPVSQDRHVFARVFSGSDEVTQRFDAMNYDLFSATASAELPGGLFASAHQQSTIDPDTITASISAGSSYGGPNFGSSASSVCRVVFDLTQQSDASLMASAGGMVVSGVSFDGPGVHFAPVLAPGMPVSYAGRLDPGRYTVVLSSAAQNGGFPSASAMMTLGFIAVPAPGAGSFVALIMLGLARRNRTRCDAKQS